MKKALLSTFILIVFGFILVFAGTSQPARAFQAEFPTPTPNVEGYIIYKVQEGDTLWNIATIAGITIDQVRQLNGMADDEVIQPGKDLILGYVGPEVTATPQPTEIQIQPTATQGESTAEICVLLYNDLNGDRLRQEEEPSVAGGVMSVIKGADTAGEYSKTENTEEGFEHYCFKDLPIGTYNITVAFPDGFNQITGMTKEIAIGPGDVHYVNFGVQESKDNPAGGDGVIDEIIDDPAETKSPLMGILGSMLLLGGIGMGVYSIILARKR